MFTPVVFIANKHYDEVNEVAVWINEKKLAYQTVKENVEIIANKMSQHYRTVQLNFKFRDWYSYAWSHIQYDTSRDYKPHWTIIDLETVAKEDKWLLEYIQDAARKEYIECSQDIHSPEFKNWLEDRAQFYNNGFYEYSRKNSVNTFNTKAVYDIINKRYTVVYRCSENESDKYSNRSSYFTVAKYGEKYVVFGEGTDECGSDWLNFYIFRTYDKLEDVIEKELLRPNVCFKEAEGTDVTELYKFAERHKKVKL